MTKLALYVQPQHDKDQSPANRTEPNRQKRKSTDEVKEQFLDDLLELAAQSISKPKKGQSWEGPPDFVPNPQICPHTNWSLFSYYQYNTVISYILLSINSSKNCLDIKLIRALDWWELAFIVQQLADALDAFSSVSFEMFDPSWQSTQAL